MTRRRYVEIAYTMEGEPRWFAGFTEAYSPKEAVAEAEAELRRQHPGLTDAEVDVFLVREVDADKEREIREAIDAGRWTGW